ncbi:PREDICTED: uncharacterized protein LOC106147901 [Chinchilla lanigera]|uniref:uncharacterized protein LOC106147901 n=1 Tax=Chinchilla lanigera TaxID=34839 RepID=UPI000696F3E4|nr:PREDICTED: uncharacterized protein LOC106147901 [Chinchilla lanigera]
MGIIFPTVKSFDNYEDLKGELHAGDHASCLPDVARLPSGSGGPRASRPGGLTAAPSPLAPVTGARPAHSRLHAPRTHVSRANREAKRQNARANVPLRAGAGATSGQPQTAVPQLVSDAGALAGLRRARLREPETGSAEAGERSSHQTPRQVNAQPSARVPFPGSPTTSDTDWPGSLCFSLRLCPSTPITTKMVKFSFFLFWSPLYQWNPHSCSAVLGTSASAPPGSRARGCSRTLGSLIPSAFLTFWGTSSCSLCSFGTIFLLSFSASAVLGT